MFLSDKKPAIYYDSALKVALNKKGRGFLINWVVCGLKKYYDKDISTKYIKQFLPNSYKIQELEEEKVRLTRCITLSKDLSGEWRYREELYKINSELSVLKRKSSKKISNLIQRYDLKTKKSLYMRKEKVLIKHHKVIEVYEHGKKETERVGVLGKYHEPTAYLSGVKNITTGEEYQTPKQEVIFNLIPQ